MKVYYFVILVCAFIAGSVSAANPQVTLHVTGVDANDLPFEGDIVLELYLDKAPVTVENFINYVQTGFYDGLIFHRIISGFMVQTGGFDADFNAPETNPEIVNECYNGLSNLRGTISMARISDPDSASSQFFINHEDNPGLDIGNYQVYYEYYMGNFYPVTAKLPGYAVFGQVISGMDIVEVIAAIPTENGVDVPDIGTFDDVPVNDIIIETAVLSSPVCLEKLEGDIDGDCDVDLTDFAKLAANWLECNAINDCQ